MEPINILELPKGYVLHRYDLIKPPTQWSIGFKNPIYVENESGVKNYINAFFFFNSYEQAYKTGMLQQQNSQTSNDGCMYMTKCVIKDNLKLLDLSKISHCTNLIRQLKLLGFDIINHIFIIATDAELEELKHTIDNVVDIRENYPEDCYDLPDFVQGIHYIEYFLGFDEMKPGYLCQRLSDCKTGMLFKHFLLSHGYEGYVFDESYRGSNAYTFCILEPDKLEQPNCNMVKI